MDLSKKFNFKYSLTQALFFGSYCALMGYASVYLLANGFSNSVIGTVLALTSIIGVFTQPAIATYADKHPDVSLRKLILLFMIGAVILSAIIFFLHGKSAILLVVFVSIVTFMGTIMPLVNSLPYKLEEVGIKINFGLARGMGSITYAIVSIVVGYLVEAFGSSLLPIIYFIFNVLLTLVVYTFIIPQPDKTIKKEEVKKEDGQSISIFQFVVRYKKFMIFILGTLLIYFTHTLINNFFIQVLRPIGGTESQMGTAIFIAAAVELPAMAVFDKLREKIGCTNLIKIAVIIWSVKHIITWLAPNIIVIYLAQILQMASFAIVTPAGVAYVNATINGNDVVKGQSMLTMGMSASGIIANFAGGILLDAIGVSSVLFIGAIVSIIGTIVTIFALDPVK